MLGLGSVLALPTAHADTINNNRSSIQANLKQANSELYSVQSELAKFTEQLKRAEQAYNDNQNLIVKTESEITAANLEIKKLDEEVASLKKAVAKRTEILKERAISYQESGGDIRYLDVILGASSFSDFIDRVGAVATIMDADKDMLEKYEQDQIDVKQKQVAVKEKLVDLTDMKTELEGMRAGLAEQKAQNESLRAELKQQEAASLAVKNGLQRSLTAQQVSMTPRAANTYAQVQSIPGASGKIAIITTAGNRYIGNSVYVFGGGRSASDVAAGRFDCSGFVSWAYSQAGVSIGASTSALQSTGRKVSTSEMRPGDLIFFNTYKTNGHVGIYLGGSSFIGSQNSTGVAVANFSSGYWAGKFSGHVRRVIE